jgi:hypothetical protein
MIATRISFRNVRSLLFFARVDHTASHVGSSIRRKHKHVPPPTWSIQELHLDNDAMNAEPLSPELLASLSRRALLRIPDDDSYRNDLAKMMQLIQQVVNWNTENEERLKEMDDAELYDLPRGVTEAPLRSDDEVLTETHPAVSLEKTVSIGGHKYFAIQTKS